MRRADVHGRRKGGGGSGDVATPSFEAMRRRSGAVEKPAVILNGVSPWAKAGAKRSEGSLTETRAEAAGVMAGVLSHRLRPFTVSGSSRRLCRKASKGFVQNDGRVLGCFAVLLLVLAMLCGRALAGGGDFEAANQACDQGKFSEAKMGYEKLVEEGAWSANLFYNLGNADYRLGAPGRAMLDYERALALDPAHPEARANLALLRMQTGARRHAEMWQDQVFPGRAVDVWTIVATAAGWLALFALALIFTSKRAEKSGLWLATVASVLVCAYAAGVLWWQAQDRALAIVVVQATEARLAPADSAGLAEALPAGSRVQVLSERGEWIYCTLPGTGRGWIPQRAVERVRLGKT